MLLFLQLATLQRNDVARQGAGEIARVRPPLRNMSCKPKKCVAMQVAEKIALCNIALGFA